MAGNVLTEAQPWQQVLALVMAAAVVMGSPGPATMSVTAVGAACGLRPSLRYTCGVVLGTTAVLLVVAAGLVGVLTSTPGLAPSLTVASAAYILYLAFTIATALPLAEASMRSHTGPVVVVISTMNTAWALLREVIIVFGRRPAALEGA